MEYRVEKDLRTERLTDEQLKAQRARSIAIALGLLALVGVFYYSTIVKFGPRLMDRPEITLAPDKSVEDPDFTGPKPLNTDPLPAPATVPATGGSD